MHPFARSKPDLVIRKVQTHHAHTRMQPDKNPNTKGVELRTVRLIVDAAESLLRQDDSIETIEIHVNFVDRDCHPNLTLDLGKVLHDAQTELRHRIDDLQSSLKGILAYEYNGGTILTGLEFTKDDVGA